MYKNLFNLQLPKGQRQYQTTATSTNITMNYTRVSKRSSFSGESNRMKKFFQGWSCDFCSQIRNSSNAVLEHIVLKHTSFGQKCECRRIFTNSAELRQHIGEIHISPHYMCTICQQGYNYKMMMETHLKKQHNLDQKI